MANFNPSYPRLMTNFGMGIQPGPFLRNGYEFSSLGGNALSSQDEAGNEEDESGDFVKISMTKCKEGKNKVMDFTKL